MKKWSNDLIKLSRKYLKISGTMVKSLQGEFGILDIENNIYYILILNSDITLTFNSVEDILLAGWVVD